MSDGVYNKCIVAPDAAECASLLKKCVSGNKDCIDTFKGFQSYYVKGMRKDNRLTTYLNELLEEIKLKGIIDADTSKTSEAIMDEWKNNLGSTEEANKVKANIELINILTYLVEFYRNPDFTGDPTTMDSARFFFSERPTDATRFYDLLSLEYRPTPRTTTIDSNGKVQMTGGGSINEKKSLSYVNKIRYLDSLNTYYNMVGGSVDPTISCAEQLKNLYEDVNDNLKQIGKKIEDGDHKIMEEMIEKFNKLENKITETHTNITTLSSMPSSNVNTALEKENEILKTSSKYLSSQGKTLTSILSSLFENSNQVADSYKVINDARIQFPQHTVA